MKGSEKVVVAVDTETTGLGHEHRVITIGAIRATVPTTTASISTSPPLSAIHLVFDPQRRSDSRAVAVHGWTDELLKGQDQFAVHANAIAAMIEGADLVVAHNLTFDTDMLDREFNRVGRRVAWPSGWCTMRRNRELSRPGRLDAAIAECGFARRETTHGALEDAALALLLFEVQTIGAPVHTDLLGELFPPTNYRHPLPPRAYRSKSPGWKAVAEPMSLLAEIVHADGIVGPRERQILREVVAELAIAAGRKIAEPTLNILVEMLASTAPTEGDLTPAREWLASSADRATFSEKAGRLIKADGQVTANEIAILAKLVATATGQG